MVFVFNRIFFFCGSAVLDDFSTVLRFLIDPNALSYSLLYK